MPGGDGIELLKQVKAYNTDLPVVIFRSGFSDASISSAYEMGAEAVFLKPYERKVLFEVVERVLVPIPEKWKTRPQRVRSSLEVKFDVLDVSGVSKGRIEASGYVTTLGRGEFFTSSEEVLPSINQQVAFRISGPPTGNHQLTGMGIVRWIRDTASGENPRGFGAEFSCLDQASSGNLFILLNSIKTTTFIPTK